MILLLRTFFDIIALRRGPESVPNSYLVLFVALTLMAVSILAAMAIDIEGETAPFSVAFLAYLLGLAFYGAIIYLAGRGARMLQSLSSIIATGAIITLIFVAEFLLVRPWLGLDIARNIAALIILWAVPVEGHIMARTIDQSWFVGIVIAMLAFVLQFGVRLVLVSQG